MNKNEKKHQQTHMLKKYVEDQKYFRAIVVEYYNALLTITCCYDEPVLRRARARHEMRCIDIAYGFWFRGERKKQLLENS